MRKPFLIVAALLAFANSGLAQDKHTQVTPDTVIWKDNPAFPKGVQVATLVGDPSKAGDAVVLRIKFPANFQMPAHTHPYSEVVTIISDAIGTSQGEKFEKKGELLKPGALCGLPPEKWSSLMYGLWPDGGLKNGKEATHCGRDRHEAAAG
jgi:quercetin dioxygenase-like cupin family protein